MNLKLTLNQMLLSNVHIGHTCRFLNVKIKPFLLGYRNDIHIINITHTSFQFKLVINFLINIFSLRQKLLIVRELDFFDFARTLQLKNIFYYDKK
jgi:ribosomal protein S2